MDEATVSRAREPFFTTKGPEGTGLGLAVADRIAHAYRGRLELESTPGEGTRARLVFPLTSSPPGPGKAEPPMVPPLRVLVVEDEPQVRELLERMLTGDGHTVAIAPHGEEGVRRFREALEEGRPFDLVITDLGMPGMDGREVAQRVRALGSEVPILLLTGWGTALPGGQIPEEVNLTLTKPPRLTELREALWELTGGTGTR
jgi:CheY-like chemotaxis protein